MPGPGLRARAGARGAAAALAHAAAAHRARPARRRGQRGARRSSTGSRPTSWSGSAATSPPPAYLAARRRGLPIVVHEANPRPGPGQPARRPAHRPRLHRLPRRPAAGRAVHRHPAPPRHRLRSTGCPWATRPAPGSGWSPIGPRCWCSAAPRGPARLNEAAARRRAPAPLGGHPGAARDRAQEHRRARAAAGRPPVRHSALRRPHGSRLRRRRLRALPQRRAHLRRATAVGLPAAYVPLPHGNGEQRLNAQPIVAGGGGFMVDDAELSADWIIETSFPCSTTPSGSSPCRRPPRAWAGRTRDMARPGKFWRSRR